MMKKITRLFLILSLSLGLAISLKVLQSSAANNNSLIDDAAFDNYTSMTAAQIDTWLNSNFPNSCISPNSGFSASDPIGYSPDVNFVDGHYQYGSPVTAGQVIYDAAVGHSISPQVLLTKLQNEEQLVDGSAGCSSTWRYASAVGYACTDSDTFSHDYTYTPGADPYTNSSALVTPLYYRNGVAVNSISGSCVNKNVKAGFSEQVVHAAWLLSFSRHKSEGQTSWASVKGNWNHCEDNATCAASYNIPASWACYSGFMTQGSFKRCPFDSDPVPYDGLATIDGTTIHMDNGATAALYVYTPHLQSFSGIYFNWFIYQAQAVGQSAYPAVKQGQSAPVYMRYQNTGGATWYDDVSASSNGSKPVHLATDYPLNRDSVFSTHWATKNRTNTVFNRVYNSDMSLASDQHVVQPGQIAEFWFDFNAPFSAKPGFYSEAFRPVVEGYGPMNDTGSFFGVTIVALNYKAQAAGQSAYPSIKQGQTAMVYIRYKNTGGDPWYDDVSAPGSENLPVHLSTDFPINRISSFSSKWFSGNRTSNTFYAVYSADGTTSTTNQHLVNPGEIAEFSFKITAPFNLSPGTYNEAFRPVVEWFGPMNDTGTYLSVNVSQAIYSAQAAAQSSYPTVKPSQSAPVFMRYRNTGNVNWYDDSSAAAVDALPVHLSTDYPLNRFSPFSSNWPYPHRPAVVFGKVFNADMTVPAEQHIVQPGQYVEFWFAFNASPSLSTGVYIEGFRPVIEGYGPMNDTGTFFKVTVSS